MIQIQQIKLQIPHTEEKLREKARKLLGIREADILSFRIAKRSLDARKKPELFYVYTVELEVKNEARIRRRTGNKNIRVLPKPAAYCAMPGTDCTKAARADTEKDSFSGNRPVVIGSGPAGLFCAYQLARCGCRPIVLERGADVDTRVRDVEEFWRGGKLKTDSNVQFGEGGAGTFSDGKLNTLVHDESGRQREVFRLFVKFGAPEQILYDSKPHIGTDILVNVVKNMREEIIRLGGEVCFHRQVTGFETETDMDGRRYLKALAVTDPRTGEHFRMKTETAVLAVGHSARDTFRTLVAQGFDMTAKSFAVGVRVEHPQQFINESQYGKGYSEVLPAASYKLTARASDGRGVYTFCMCPGGYVVNASSEEGHIAVNGMSYSGRRGKNANSAVIVTVTPEDFGGTDVLAGMEFQRRLEEAAYREGCGRIPVQRFEDFLADRPSAGAGRIEPQIKGAYTWANVRAIFPGDIAAAIGEGILAFDRKIAGYADVDAVLSGVESRTSSPVRILRDDSLMSNVRSVYPCGEGAGYAGGITSAATDGLKVAETVIKSHRPFDSRAYV